MIVDAAMTLLDRKGLDGVTMRAVAKRLRVGAMTLYTYLDGQDALRRAMVRRGFDLLREGCASQSTVDTDGRWTGGARTYIEFALARPALYRLMFDTPMPPEDNALFDEGFAPLRQKVREKLAARGVSDGELDAATRRAAGRYWIALHGLATLAIAGRLHVLEAPLEEVLDDLLVRVAPT